MCGRRRPAAPARDDQDGPEGSVHVESPTPPQAASIGRPFCRSWATLLSSTLILVTNHSRIECGESESKDRSRMGRCLCCLNHCQQAGLWPTENSLQWRVDATEASLRAILQVSSCRLSYLILTGGCSCRLSGCGAPAHRQLADCEQIRDDFDSFTAVLQGNVNSTR